MKTTDKIQAFAAIVALVFSTIAVWQTHSILNHQQNDAHIQYRAYLSVHQSDSDKVIFENNYYNFPFIFENKGLTAAEKMKFSIYILFSNGEKFAIASSSDQKLFLVRKDSYKILFGIPIRYISYLPNIQRGSGNFLVVDAEYSDYQDQRYLLQSKYVIQPPDIKNLGIYEIQEINIENN